MKTFDMTVIAADAYDLSDALRGYADRLDRLGERSVPAIGENRAILKGVEVIGGITQIEPWEDDPMLAGGGAQ